MTQSEILQSIADRGDCFVPYAEAQDLFRSQGSLGYLWRDVLRGFCHRYQLDYEYDTPHPGDKLASLVRTNGYRFRPRVDSALDYAAAARERAQPEGLPPECDHFITGQCDLCESEARIESHITLSKADYDQIQAALDEPPKPNAKLRELMASPSTFDLQAGLITDTFDTMDQVLTADPQATEVFFEGNAEQLVPAISLATVGNKLANAGFPHADYPSVQEQLDAAIEELHQLRSDKAAAEERSE